MTPPLKEREAMSEYTVKDNHTGKTVTFKWNAKEPPTNADMEEVFAAAAQMKAPPGWNEGKVMTAPAGWDEGTPIIDPYDEKPRGIIDPYDPAPTPSGLTPMSFGRPALEIGGMTVGGLLGTPAGPVGSVAGAGLGYGIGKGIADMIERKPQPSTVSGALLSGAKDVGTGMLTEATGQVAGVALGKGLQYAGKFGKQAIGKLTGAGTGAAEEAYKGGQAFTDAMRGSSSPDDLVNSTRAALAQVKANRAATYQKQLAGIQGGKEIDITPIQMKMSNLMQKYGVRVEADGSLNMTRTSLGKAGNKDVEDVVQTIRGWGQQSGDKTAVGLDTLKRQLDDFYSDSSNARGFVAELRNEVKGTIVKNVPQYAEMTKDYGTSTAFIKDAESALMLRKQGMSGRITADQTLRRLISSMKDNYLLRRELLEVLGDQGGKDLTGAVAGVAMNPLLPNGLAGIPASLAGSAAFLHYLNPQFLPLLALSSPRVAGEFLRLVGTAAKAAPGAGIAAAKAAGYLTVPPAVNR